MRICKSCSNSIFVLVLDKIDQAVTGLWWMLTSLHSALTGNGLVEWPSRCYVTACSGVIHIGYCSIISLLRAKAQCLVKSLTPCCSRFLSVYTLCSPGTRNCRYFISTTGVLLYNCHKEVCNIQLRAVYARGPGPCGVCNSSIPSSNVAPIRL